MQPVIHSRFIENYVEPIISHPVTQVAFQMVKEVVKIVAVKIFLDLANQQIQKKLTYSTKWQVAIVHIVVTAPMIEELIFRGILLNGVRLLEKGVHFFILRREPTDQEERIEQIVRIHFSAFLFAAIHLMNPYSPGVLLMQFVCTYIDGAAYGYLNEKYHSLAPSILGHGLNNIFAVAGDAYPELKGLFTVGYIANKITVYILSGCLEGLITYDQDEISKKDEIELALVN